MDCRALVLSKVVFSINIKVMVMVVGLLKLVMFCFGEMIFVSIRLIMISIVIRLIDKVLVVKSIIVIVIIIRVIIVFVVIDKYEE